MTISISNLTINNNAPPSSVIGMLTALDPSGAVVPCTFNLTKNSAGFFAISGNSLVTAFNGSILAGNYSVRVHATGTNTRFGGNATFNIAVTVAAPPPPPPPPPPPSVSPDGAIIFGGRAGTLITSEGTWTFGSPQRTGGGDWPTQLNGTANGYASQMQIANGGKLYAFAKDSGHWYLRQNVTWVDVGAISPNGLAVYGGQPGVLTTSEGTWTFGSPQRTRGVDWPTQLNGTANGYSSQMQITNGNFYVFAKDTGHWYLWQNHAWVDVGTTAPVQGAVTPIAITLSPASATITDNAPAGTVIATANVTMSDGSQFSGTLTTSDTNFFAVSGQNIVTARAYISADDGAHSTVITASQGGQSLSMESSL